MKLALFLIGVLVAVMVVGLLIVGGSWIAVGFGIGVGLTLPACWWWLTRWKRKRYTVRIASAVFSKEDAGKPFTSSTLGRCEIVRVDSATQVTVRRLEP